MHPHYVAFGGGSTDSVISPLVMVTLALALIMVFALPRRWVLAPYLLFTFLTPLGQGFYVGGAHLFANRIMILCTCARMYLMEGAFTKLAGGFNALDKVFLLWAFVRASAFILLYQDGGAVLNQFGTLWDSVGGYLVVRALITDREDILRATKVMAVLGMVLAGCMMFEYIYAKNVFGMLLGGSTEVEIRSGSVRSRGVFEHEILAGCFGATLLPLFIWLWRTGSSKMLALIGMISAVVMTFTATSSTGISAIMAGIGALCCWPIRTHMKAIRWAMVAGVTALSMVMKAPVWFLLARVDFTGGSTGWDRANLVDQCVRHFSNWWLIGTKDTANWGYDTWDLCNQFVTEAENGGFFALLLFMGLIYLAFRYIGLARASSENNPDREHLLWALGAVLVAHMAAFIGVGYFDQTQIWWFMGLALVCAAALPIEAEEKVTAERTGGESLALVRPALSGFGRPSEVDLAWAGQRLARAPYLLAPPDRSI